MQELINELIGIEQKRKVYIEQEEKLQKLQYEQNEQLLKLNELLALNKSTKELYTASISLIYNKSLGQLEEEINLGLQFIFYDKNYKIKFQLGDSRNKTVKILLHDLETDKITNLKKGNGAGVRSVISFIFLTYYLISKKSYPIMFLDESYSEISAEYVENFFRFVTTICRRKGFTVVMVSHDERFINFSDEEMRIQDGRLLYHRKNKD